VLPLSESHRLSADLGTRHRAGVGISEVSDAVVIIVSEETGTISVAVGGVLKRHLASKTLEKLLRKELCPVEEEKEPNLALRLLQKLQKNKDGGSNEK
jgi:diadenylate cyclase